MVTKKYKQCDYCGSTDLNGDKIENIFLQTGWRPDVTDGPSEPDGKEYDLCVKCMAGLCQALLINIRIAKLFDLNKIAVEVFEHARMGSP